MSEKTIKESQAVVDVDGSRGVEDVHAHAHVNALHSVRRADDALLADLGYKAVLRREFSVCEVSIQRQC